MPSLSVLHTEASLSSDVQLLASDTMSSSLSSSISLRYLRFVGGMACDVVSLLSATPSEAPVAEWATLASSALRRAAPLCTCASVQMAVSPSSNLMVQRLDFRGRACGGGMAKPLLFCQWPLMLVHYKRCTTGTASAGKSGGGGGSVGAASAVGGSGGAGGSAAAATSAASCQCCAAACSDTALRFE